MSTADGAAFVGGPLATPAPQPQTLASPSAAAGVPASDLDVLKPDNARGRERFIPVTSFALTHDPADEVEALARCGVSIVAITTTSLLALRKQAADAVLRGQARGIAGASFSGGVESPLPGGGGGGAGSINLSISGPDLNTVTQLSNQAQNVLQTVPGVVDVRNSNLNTVPELDITLDRTKMAQLLRQRPEVIEGSIKAHD